MPAVSRSQFYQIDGLFPKAEIIVPFADTMYPPRGLTLV
jgi:hypothetical protein